MNVMNGKDRSNLARLAMSATLAALVGAALLGACLTAMWKENRHNRGVMLWQATEIMRLENELTELRSKR